MDVLKRNNVTVKGEGTQPMMFVHGFGCDQNMWRFVAPEFEKEYKTILLDLTGSGKSDLTAYSTNKYNTLNGYADDVLEICEALKLKDVIFVGHSVSSMIGLLAAKKNPGYFEKLIFIGPSPRYIDDEGYKGGFSREDLEGLLSMMDSNYLGWSGSVAPMIMGNADRPYLGEELTNSFCAADPEIAKHFARVTFFSDNRADLPGLKIPSLILQCSDDIIAPTQVGRYMHENTPGSTYVELKATGHCPHVSEPEETIQAIRSFLK